MSYPDQSHWLTFLAQVKDFSLKQKLIPSKVFISYAWEGDEVATGPLQARLTRLRDDLLSAGMTSVFFDVSNMTGNIVETMQTELAQSDIVLAICTPKYGTRVKDVRTNVGFEYQKTLEKLKANHHSVLPLILGGSFMEAVPESLRGSLVRDCRDPWQHEWHMGSIEAPLGIIPALYGIRLDTEVGRAYQELWKAFTITMWGSTGSPASLLHSLKRLSDTMFKDESIYQQIKGYYIQPSIRDRRDGEVVDDLKTFLDEDIIPSASTGAGNVYLLFGDSGTGKSTAMLYLEERLWAEFPTTHIVPVRIPLNRIAREPKNFLTHWFKEQCGYTEEQISALKRHYRIALLLDGYDELVFNQGTRNLLSDAQLSGWPGIVFISCRTQLESECAVFDDYRQQQRQSSCVRRYLNLFTPAQIQQYVSTRAATDKQLTLEVRSTLENTPSLLSLVTNPLVLFMVVDILPDLAVLLTQETPSPAYSRGRVGVGEITRYQIYEVFTQKWFSREFTRIINEGALAQLNLRGSARTAWQSRLLHYAEQIAILMYQRQTVIIEQSQLEHEEQQFLYQVLKNEVQAGQMVDVLRNACPLKAVGRDHYQFIHKSFQEFLVAQVLNQRLCLDARYSSEQFQTQLGKLNQHVWNSIELYREPEVLAFLADTEPSQYRLMSLINASNGQPFNVWPADELGKPLYRDVKKGIPEYQMVHYEKSPEGFSPIAQAAGNAITLYTYCGYTAANFNLSNIHVKNADISAGMLQGANMRNTRWEQVRANQVDLCAADLSHSHVDMDFEEYPNLQRKDSNSAIVSYALSPTENNILAVAYEDNIVIVWDWVSTKELQRSRYPEKIVSMSFEHEGVVIGNYLWDYKNNSFCEFFGNNIGFKKTNNSIIKRLNDTFEIWDEGLQKIIMVLSQKYIENAYFSLNSSLVFNSQKTKLLINNGDTQQLWDVKTEVRLKKYYGENAHFSLDEHVFFIQSKSTINIYPVSDIKERKQQTQERFYCGIFWLPKNQSKIFMFNLEGFAYRPKLDVQFEKSSGLNINMDWLINSSLDYSMYSVGFSYSGRQFACYMQEGLGYFGLKIYDITMRTIVFEFGVGDYHHLGPISYRHDDLQIVTRSDNDTYFIDLKTGSVTKFEKVKDFCMNVCVYAPNDQQLAMGSSSGKTCGQVGLYNFTNDEFKLLTPQHKGGVRCLSYRPDNLQLASGGENIDNTICLWDTQTGERQYELLEHTTGITILQYFQDIHRSWLLSIDYNGLVIAWDCYTGQAMARGQVPAHHTAAITDDLKELVLAIGDQIWYAKVPMSHFITNFPHIPQWQCQWVRATSFTAQGTNIEKTQFTNPQMESLVKQYGAVDGENVSPIKIQEEYTTVNWPVLKSDSPKISRAPSNSSMNKDQIEPIYQNWPIRDENVEQSSRRSSNASIISLPYPPTHQRAIDESNNFIRIHTYLALKQFEKQGNDGGRVQDFLRLLSVLKQTDTESFLMAVRHYLDRAPGFHRSNPFNKQGNRYYRLRINLTRLVEAQIKIEYLEYLDWLQTSQQLNSPHPNPAPASGGGNNDPRLVVGIEQLRRQLCIALGPARIPPIEK